MRLWLIVVAIMLSGCSWQGQRQYAADGTTLSEWWSMRWCWMSAGVESYTKTPYYETGAVISKSASDPNSITATGEAAGQMLNEIIKGMIVP